MTLNLTNEIRAISQEKNISEELITETIETALTFAYKKYYGTTENLAIDISDDFVFTVNSIKEVVEELDDDLYEIELGEATAIEPSAKIGDKLEVPCDPKEFGQLAIHTAKQTILQKLKEIEKHSQYSEYKSKEGQLVAGYVQRIKDDIIYVDLGSYEGTLIKTQQAPHEKYNVGDRIKTLIYNVSNNTKRGGLTVGLTRRSEDFVKKLLMIEIPELDDGIIKIEAMKREAGYRTKVAVSTDKMEIDPIGACIGQRGARIQNIIKELEGEKIDIIRWVQDPRGFIMNALTPANVIDVVITSEEEKTAVAVMDDSQLALAIGQRGANIILAKKLTGFNIEVLTEADAIEQGLLVDHNRRAEELFKDSVVEDDEQVEDDVLIEEGDIGELEVNPEIKRIIVDNGITTIDALIDIEDFSTLEGITAEMAQELSDYIEANYDIIEEDNEEVYECPECGADIPGDATKCPNCGTEIEFEEIEE